MFVKTDSASITRGVLRPVEPTRQFKPSHVYLGHWIERSPKMAYKAQFQPHQLLMDGQWVATDDKRGSRPPGLGWSNTMS